MLVEDTDFREEIIDLENPYDVKPVSKLLEELGFSFHPESVDYSLLLYNLKGEIIGTGSSQKNVLKYVAVTPKFRESTAFSKIIAHLTERIAPNYHTTFVFTRPANIPFFEGIGFKLISTAQPLFALLEYGTYTICKFQLELKKKYKQISTTNNIASIVVNCNPFTNGHKYLIEKASEENEWVYLFVVQEDLSVFPFETRWRLIKEGIAHLKNVIMIPGGDYVVSGKTFPYYFLKGVNDKKRIAGQVELDIDIFRRYIAPILGISKRYVGTETYCATTAAYNQAMKGLLAEKDIQLIEIERKKGSAHEEEQSISASKIRNAIKNDDLDSFIDFTPETTKRFLLSPEADELKRKIRESAARH